MPAIITAKHLNLWYGDHHALQDINLEIPANQITALIGPSGCGKSTFLKTLNRMNDLVPGVRIQGKVRYRDTDLYHAATDVTWLRKQIGMVFQKANPFPMSIYDNIAYGPRTHGIRRRAELDEIVERSLRSAAIWEEVTRPTQDQCTGPVRRAAAAAVHCPGPGGGAGYSADGRIHQRAGPHLHGQD